MHGIMSFDVLCVKIGSGASAVGRWKNPKKKPSKHFDAQFRAYGEKNPLRDHDYILHVGIYPGPNIVCNIW